MTKYIEYFQVEAKCLLKDFKKNFPEAKSRCETYFSGKSDLSLMNAQHVIAKEYGFESWNDLISKEPHKLAEALIVAKNKTFNSPFKLWHGGRITTGYEENKYKLYKPEDYQLKYDAKKKAFISDRSEYTSFEHLDVSDYDLSGIDPLKIRYSEDTKWSEDPAKLPLGFNPKEFLESRKNPGLGIKTLHKLGIKGQGRNIVIIDNFRLFNHIEYQNSLKGYEEIGFDPTNYGGGAGGSLISALVGKTCGIAPSSNAYFYAVDNNNYTSQINYAIVIKKVCELHKKLIAEGKNGIDVIFTFRDLTNENFSNIEGYEETLNAIKEAEDLGIWCNCAGVLNSKENPNIRIGHIYCKLDGNVDNPDDYIPLRNPNSKWRLLDNYKNALCFPCGAKTVSLDVKMDEYVFEHYSNRYASTYASGLYLLAKSIKETITPYEFFELGLKTGTFKEGVGTIINPVALIESLK